MNITTRGMIELPVRFNQKKQSGYCTLRINGDFYLLRFGRNLLQKIEQAALHKKEVFITGTGHSFKSRECGKHHFYIKAASID